MNSYIVFQYRLNSVVGNLKFWTNTQKKLYSKASQVELEGRWGLRETGSVSRELFTVRNKVLQESKKMKGNEGRYGDLVNEW